MSKFRVQLDTSFTNEKDAVSFLNLCQGVKAKLYKGKGDEKIPIISSCRYHECFHDETPPKPCGNYVTYDLKDDVKVDVKDKSGVLHTADDLLKKGV